MKIPRIVNLFSALLLGLTVMAPVQHAQAVVYVSDLTDGTFSIDDVQGDFAGNTFGGTTTSAGTIAPDRRHHLWCTRHSDNACGAITPIPIQKLLGQTITLYPVDSEFGYDVIDFLGAAQKMHDFDYAEGFVGDVTSGFPTQAIIDGVTFQFTNADLDQHL